MNFTPKPGRIAVSNNLLEGVSLKAELPTYILDTLGFSASEVGATIDSVGLLQAMAPVFRIVLATDQSVFGSARSLGWPVEHFLPAEHREGAADSGGQKDYVNSRFSIAKSHYQQTIVVRASDPAAFLESIADLVGRPDLSAIASAFIPQDLRLQSNSAHWPSVERELVATGISVFDSTEGSARLSNSGPIRESAFISGYANGEVSASQYLATPAWVSSIQVEFDADSSLAFEAHIYWLLAKTFGDRLAIVHPWRGQSLLSDLPLHWVDIGLYDAGAELRVQREFAEAYEVLAGSDRFDWDNARKYAAIRRVSRRFSARA